MTKLDVGVYHQGDLKDSRFVPLSNSEQKTIAGSITSAVRQVRPIPWDTHRTFGPRSIKLGVAYSAEMSAGPKPRGMLIDGHPARSVGLSESAGSPSRTPGVSL